MHRGCRERFPHHRLQRKPLVSDPGMHHGTCVMHVPWCMSGSLTRGAKTLPAFPVHAQPATFTYLVRGPWKLHACKFICIYISPIPFSTWSVKVAFGNNHIWLLPIETLYIQMASLILLTGLLILAEDNKLSTIHLMKLVVQSIFLYITLHDMS